MKAKEKAKELVEAFDYPCYECGGAGNEITSALRAVDEIMKALDGMFGTVNDNFYWKEVKTEIEKL